MPRDFLRTEIDDTAGFGDVYTYREGINRFGRIIYAAWNLERGPTIYKCRRPVTEKIFGLPCLFWVRVFEGKDFSTGCQV